MLPSAGVNKLCVTGDFGKHVKVGGVCLCILTDALQTPRYPFHFTRCVCAPRQRSRGSLAGYNVPAVTCPCIAWCQDIVSGVWGHQMHSEPHTTPVPHQYLPSCPSLSIPLASVFPSWQVCFYLCKAFLRHSSPSYLLGDLEELQWVAHIPSRRKGKDKVCFQNENFWGGFFLENLVRFELCIPRSMEVDLLCKRGFSFKLIIRRIHLNLCQVTSDAQESSFLWF